jgi:hypothetical protein
MKLFALTFSALALLAAVGQAAPFESKNIAADAKWVVHVDVDAVRESSVVQKAFETCPLLKNDSGKHFDMIRDKIGVDLRTDLHGITVYGPDTDKTHGVAIVFATVNKKLLLEKAAKATDHKVTKHGEVEIHSWTQKCGSQTHPAAGAFYKDDVLVFAGSVQGVAAAIDVLDGKSPGITDAKSVLGGHVYAGSTVLVRSIAIPAKTRCPILKQAESFRIALGEHDGKSFYRAIIHMKSPEAAEQVKSINEGFKALGALRFADDADVMKLVDGFKTTTKESVVRIRFDASADDVWTVVDKLGKKAMEHFKKMHSGEKKTAAGSPLMKGAKAGTCPAGCQCPACKAKAEAKAKADAKAKGGKTEK